MHCPPATSLVLGGHHTSGGTLAPPRDLIDQNTTLQIVKSCYAKGRNMLSTGTAYSIPPPPPAACCALHRLFGINIPATAGCQAAVGQPSILTRQWRMLVMQSQYGKATQPAWHTAWLLGPPRSPAVAKSRSRHWMEHAQQVSTQQQPLKLSTLTRL
jgi:hypothetical protein